jgi:hypothetical protein
MLDWMVRWESRLVWVQRPLRPVPSPHPAEQFEGPGVFVSDFVDTRNSRTMEVRGSDLPLFYRTAHHRRSFRITRPTGGEREALACKRVPGESFGVRRFVQFAAPVPRAEGDGRIVVETRFTRRVGLGWWLLPALLAFAVYRLRAADVRSRLGAIRLAAQSHASLVGVTILVLLAFGSLWKTVVHPDEFFTVDMAREVLTSGDYALENFAYPHRPAYLQALGTVAYGILLERGCNLLPRSVHESVVFRRPGGHSHSADAL